MLEGFQKYDKKPSQLFKIPSRSLQDPLKIPSRSVQIPSKSLQDPPRFPQNPYKYVRKWVQNVGKIICQKEKAC